MGKDLGCFCGSRKFRMGSTSADRAAFWPHSRSLPTPPVLEAQDMERLVLLPVVLGGKSFGGRLEPTCGLLVVSGWFRGDFVCLLRGLLLLRRLLFGDLCWYDPFKSAGISIYLFIYLSIYLSIYLYSFQSLSENLMISGTDEPGAVVERSCTEPNAA